MASSTTLPPRPQSALQYHQNQNQQINNFNNPSNNNLLWGLTNDNKIAFIKTADFKSLKNSTSKQKVRMHIHKQKVTTYEDVANVLFH
jgi:hypothetical protein